MLTSKSNNYAGHVVGVGGIVIRQGQVLLVKHNYGNLQGQWLLPGGHVDLGENLDAAVEREVMEETGVRAIARGIMAVRSKILPDSRLEVYVVFLMEYVSGEATVGSPAEIEAVGYFTLEQVKHLTVTPLARAIINQVLTQPSRPLPLQINFRYNAPGFRFYLGTGLEE